MLLDELDGYYASGLPIERPNSMNNYGIIVNAIALGVTLNFALIYSDLMAWLLLGAPFVPSAGNKIDAAFGMLPPGTRRTHMVDLGSGAGAVAVAARPASAVAVAAERAPCQS